jgi:hypothetical protein
MSWGTLSEGEKISTARSGAPLANPLLLIFGQAALADESDVGSADGFVLQAKARVGDVAASQTMLSDEIPQNPADLAADGAVVFSRRWHGDQFPFVEFSSHRIVVGHLLQLVGREKSLGTHTQSLHSFRLKVVGLVRG